MYDGYGDVSSAESGERVDEELAAGTLVDALRAALGGVAVAVRAAALVDVEVRDGLRAVGLGHELVRTREVPGEGVLDHVSEPLLDPGIGAERLWMSGPSALGARFEEDLTTKPGLLVDHGSYANLSSCGLFGVPKTEELVRVIFDARIANIKVTLSAAAVM